MTSVTSHTRGLIQILSGYGTLISMIVALSLGIATDLNANYGLATRVDSSGLALRVRARFSTFASGETQVSRVSARAWRGCDRNLAITNFLFHWRFCVRVQRNWLQNFSKKRLRMCNSDVVNYNTMTRESSNIWFRFRVLT